MGAGAFAAVAGVEVAAGVLAVTGAGGCCVEAGGVAAAGVLPAFVALFALGAVDVAFSGPAVPTADFAAGVAVGAGVGDDVGDGALVPAAVVAVA